MPPSLFINKFSDLYDEFGFPNEGGEGKKTQES